MTENDFLKDYDITQYERPSMTTDVVTIRYNREKQSVQLLLIKRKEYPYKDKWSLTGGFVQKDESAEDTVIRVTKQKTGFDLSGKQIEQLYTFTDPSRDPRGWIITVSYIAFISETEEEQEGNAYWFDMELDKDQNKLILKNDKICPDEPLLVELKSPSNEDIGFDHEKLIVMAYTRIQNKLYYEPNILKVLGEKFTITESIEVFSSFMGVQPHEVARKNHMRKLLPLLTETEEKVKVGGRPASLYRLTKGE